MHGRLYDRENFFKCTMQGCNSSFSNESLRERHLRIHINDLSRCKYCPFRYVKTSAYERHLNMHFRIRDFECDQCGLKFTTKTELNIHYLMHEGPVYNCLICNKYEANRKSNMLSHLRKYHADIFGENTNWEAVKHHVNIKSC